MKPKLAKSKLPDADMRRVPQALHDAAIYAKKLAKQTGTKFITVPASNKKK